MRAGVELPPLDKGPIGYKHLARWCAAQQNWDKVHYNQDYAREYGGLKDVYVNGAIKAQSVVQFLGASFDYRGWAWRVDTDFRGMDFAGERLVVRGTIEEVVEAGRHVAARVGFRIRNRDRGADTTEGEAVVLLDARGDHVVEVDDRDLPDEWRVDTAVREAGEGVPDRIRGMVGRPVDAIESVIPVDLSRLRLMADAVMDVNPWHYHPEKAARGPFGGVVAMPLYPLHGLESWPDARPFGPRSGDAGPGGRHGRRPSRPGAVGAAFRRHLQRREFGGDPFSRRPGETIAADCVSRARSSTRITPWGRRSWSIRSTATASRRAGR